MKQEFFNFQMNKSEMSKVRGGSSSTYLCHCNTSGGTLAFEVSAESDEILDAKMKTECKGVTYSCDFVA